MGIRSWLSRLRQRIFGPPKAPEVPPKPPEPTKVPPVPPEPPKPPGGGDVIPPPKKRKYEVVAHTNVTRKGKSRDTEKDRVELRTIVEATSLQEAQIAGIARMNALVEHGYHEWLEKRGIYNEGHISATEVSPDSETGAVHLYRHFRDEMKETKTWE